jgi:hypothetical protein
MRVKKHLFIISASAKDDQGEYENAITLYGKTIEIAKKTLPPNPPFESTIILWTCGKYWTAIITVKSSWTTKVEKPPRENKKEIVMIYFSQKRQ